MIASPALTGDDLRIEDVWEVAVDGAPVALAEEARGKMEAARDLVERAVASEHTYGVNTGFGRFVSESIPEEQVEELQLRLLRSHACGVGEPYPDEVVRAAMLLRANALAKGYSGARVETVELLLECLNRGVLPRVPGARLGRGERRSGAARASRAAARRRGPGVVRRRAACRAPEALAARGPRADPRSRRRKASR